MLPLQQPQPGIFHTLLFLPSSISTMPPPTLRLHNEDEWNKFLERTKILPHDPSIDQLSEEWQNVAHMVAENTWITKCLRCYSKTNSNCESERCQRLQKAKKKRLVKCHPPSVDTNPADLSSPRPDIFNV